MSPIKGPHYLTQAYGLTSFAKSPTGKRAYKNFAGGIHPGLDFGTKGKPLPVIALVPGKVVFAKQNGGWGKHVEVLGEDGWRRQYAHLSSIAVSVGQEVAVGDVLGNVGTTGASTGVHLHYGNRKARGAGWQYRDPSPDLVEAPAEPKPITARFIKADGLPEIYLYNGKAKFHIPDMETLTFLSPKGAHTVVDAALVTKIPSGPAIPSLK